MELFYSGLGDKGNVRKNNEDYHFSGKIGTDEYLFIVADGMGGHKGGEIASRKAVTQVVRKLEKNKKTNIKDALKSIFKDINKNLYKESSKLESTNGMGTTLSVLYVKEGMAYVAHVGDSRIYLHPGTGTGNMSQLTDDHSFVGKLLKNKVITEDEARHHPRRNVIYQSIGSKPEIDIQIVPPFQIRAGQKFLLCTDGLYGVITDKEIEEHLADNSASRVAQRLIEQAKANGAPDNISIIVVSTEKDKEESTTNTGNEPEDTVKIQVTETDDIKRRRTGLLILLVLLLLLLVTVIYLVISTTGDHTLPPQSCMHHITKVRQTFFTNTLKKRAKINKLLRCCLNQGKRFAEQKGWGATPF
jgi:protein phosphatase